MAKPTLQKNKKFHQGIFRPKNPEKYLGDESPIYRSMIELRFMRFCDGNPNVVKWGSENIKIPYFDKVQNKNRTYYVDNIVKIKEGNEYKTYLIELKDIKETEPPKKTPRKRQTTLLYEELRHQNNLCKWRAAKKYAEMRGVEFMVLGYDQNKGFSMANLEILLI